MEGNEAEVKENKKINFFKKLWYSITKISKYDEMINLRWKKAVKYFLGLLSLLSIILMIATLGTAMWQGEDVTSNLLFYALIYFLGYFIVLFIIYAMYILFITISMLTVLTIFKIEDKFQDTLSMTIYSSTLSIIIYVIYLIISYFTSFVISYFDTIALLIIFIYVYLNMRKKRGVLKNGFYRRNKKQGKKRNKNNNSA